MGGFCTWFWLSYDSLCDSKWQDAIWMSRHFFCVTFLLLKWKLSYTPLSAFALNQHIDPAINPRAKDIICSSSSSHLLSFCCCQISNYATRRRRAPYHLHNTATKKWQTDLDTRLTQMSPKIHPNQNTICVVNSLAGAPSIKPRASSGTMSVAGTSARLAKLRETHRGKSESWVKTQK